MYSFKEKKRHFADLKNADVAEADILLLMSKVKQVPSSWERQPKRYADSILYRLLDVATREEIRVNRRKSMKMQDDMHSPEEETNGPAGNTIPENVVSDGSSEIRENDTLSASANDDDIQKRISEAEADKEEAEERAEEAEAAKEEAEARADKAEAAIEDEKKKE